MLITGRAHAGETHSSFIMRNMINDLTWQGDQYEYLLNNFIIKFIPMINVDGVVIGNSRSSLIGLDLNRRWTNPSPLLHPEVYFIKELMQK